MKKLLLLITTLCVYAVATAQTLSPTVVSSSGGYYTSASASLSVTVAEMTMVQTFSSASNILTQGFQQPEDYVVGIPENTTVSGDILIYPNPTNGIFTLNYFSNSSCENVIKIYNLVGQVVLTKAVMQSAGTNSVTFDISSFSQGIYILELNENSGKLSYYKKVNLIY